MRPHVPSDSGERGLSLAATVDRDDFSRHYDFSVAPGRTLGITGDIGSGKTTALWLLAGRLAAGSGRIVYQGTVWDDPAAGTRVVDRPVTLMSQNYFDDLPEKLTGTEAVVARMEELNGPDPAHHSRAAATMAGLGVQDHVVDRLPWTFSGAEAQRVALAAAIAPRPGLLLLDEPFGALDKRTSAAVRQWLARWLADFPGIAVVASTSVDHLEELSDELLTLD